MVPVHLAGEHRADLVRIAADRDDGLHRLVQELAQVLREVGGNIDADLAHHFDGQRMHVAGGFRAGAGHAQCVAGGSAQDAFGEMGAAGVASAEDEDERGFGHWT